MKTTRWSCGAVLFVIAGLCAGLAVPPRKDINPALLYFQAFSLFPELDEVESQQLGSDSAGAVTEDDRELARRFDRSFQLIHRARSMKGRCDWGTDIADGPHAFLPSFVKIRTAAHAAVLRARVALANGQESQAWDELLAASALGRHAASGASLVGVMVQVAVDMKILDFIRAHFDELKPRTRGELAAALKGAPQRQTVADAIGNEQAGFCEWLVEKLETAKAKEPDDSKVLDHFRRTVAEAFNDESDLADRIIDASGGTSTGVIRYIRAVEPHYFRAQAIARASAAEIRRETADFEKAVNATTNLLARVVIPNVGKARMKELEFESRLSRLPDSAP